MKLTKLKTISTFIASASLFGMSFAANADNLNVSNSLSTDLSFKINGTCSQEFGIVKSQTVKVIPEADFNKVCSYAPETCDAQVYFSAYCGGGIIALIVFNTKHGVQDIKVLSDIKVIGNGFNLFFEK